MQLAYTLTGAAVLALSAALLPAPAHALTYTAVLNGASEAPPTASPGIGAAIVTFDVGAMTMRLQTTFVGLLGDVTAAHIHCCTAVAGAGTVGVATQTPTFIGFPFGVPFGSYDHSFDMSAASSYRAGFITSNGGTAGSAFSALLAGAAAGQSYLNIHTTAVPSGEIRGFLAPIPEPSSYALMLAGLAALGWVSRRKVQA
ncbi:MAG: CHRD domain-containing protein [Rubrivivax sp.]|nr:CHRD domain-containing protein [Rubrivivax sp.]